MGKKVNIIILMVIITFGLWLGNLVQTIYHEDVHYQIYDRDRIKSRIEISYISGGGLTFPEEECKTETCNLSNNLNEVVGYHNIALIINLWLMFFIFAVYLEAKS